MNGINWAAFLGAFIGSAISCTVTYYAGRRQGYRLARERVTLWLAMPARYPGGCGDPDCIYCGKHEWPRVP